MYRTGDHHVKQNKSVSQRQLFHPFSHFCKLGVKNKRKQKNQGLESKSTAREMNGEGKGEGTKELLVKQLKTCENKPENHGH
jgi:hypothetical protein